MTLPSRKTPGHETPSWVPVGATFFITICCDPKKTNQLCHPGIGDRILKAIAYYHEHQQWWVDLAVLMPDHLHLLAAFPVQTSMDHVVAQWKEYVAKSCGIQWQRDFFDHRLRGGESPREKAEYIENNPVRAGLVKSPDEWPYVWKPER
jgi:putative transposase